MKSLYYFQSKSVAWNKEGTWQYCFHCSYWKLSQPIGTKNNRDQDKDQAVVVILCNSSSDGGGGGGMLCNKPTETVHLKDFSLEKVFRTSGPQLWSFLVSCYGDVCWISALLCFQFSKKTYLFLKSQHKMNYPFRASNKLWLHIIEHDCILNNGNIKNVSIRNLG